MIADLDVEVMASELEDVDHHAAAVVSWSIGFANAGVLCYMNSVFMSLLRITPVLDFLAAVSGFVHSSVNAVAVDIRECIKLLDDGGTCHAIATARPLPLPAATLAVREQVRYSVIVAVLWHRAGAAVLQAFDSRAAYSGPSPVPMDVVVRALKSLTWYNGLQNGQQDAQQFMLGCFDVLERASSWAVSNGVLTAPAAFDLSDSYTTTVDVTTALSDHNRRTTTRGYEKCPGLPGLKSDPVPLHDVALVRGPSVNRRLSACLPLSDQLRAHFGASVVSDYRCDTCNGLPRATQTRCVRRFPEYVVVVLKRYIFRERYNDVVKINDVIACDAGRRVFLYETTAGGAVQAVKYDVVSCVQHVGTGTATRSGHYFAVSNQRGVMVKFNDSAVSLVSDADAEDIFGMAYICILHRAPELVRVDI